MLCRNSIRLIKQKFCQGKTKLLVFTFSANLSQIHVHLQIEVAKIFTKKLKYLIYALRMNN